MESPLPFEDEVKALAFALDKQEEGVLVRRLLYPFFHVVHVLHGMAVYFEDDIAALDGGVIRGTARLHSGHDDARVVLGAKLAREIRGEFL